VKNILLTCVQHYVDRPSGSARIVWEEARFLAAAGHGVWVVAACEDGTAPEYEVRDGIHLLRYALPAAAGFDPRRRYMHQQATCRALERHVDASIDVLHGHAPLQFEGALQFVPQIDCKAYTVHSPAAMELIAAAAASSWQRKLQARVAAVAINKVERRCIRESNRVTALSKFTVNCLRKLHSQELVSKVSICPGWVDVDRFRIVNNRERAKRDIGWPTTIPVLFTLRRLVPRMGLNRLLGAMAILKENLVQAYLVIGGDGPMRSSLERLRNDLGLCGTVEFAGRVDDGLLPLLYGTCDAFVLPTAELECFGLIALEALACGRPVLATPIGALPELLGLIEPNWIGGGAGLQEIADLIVAFLKGDLPKHSPEALRDKVAAEFNAPRRLRELVSAICDIRTN
jgi:glycosyltransferase involved in cell wall biosynthesis